MSTLAATAATSSLIGDEMKVVSATRRWKAPLELSPFSHQAGPPFAQLKKDVNGDDVSEVDYHDVDIVERKLAVLDHTKGKREEKKQRKEGYY